MKILTMTIKKEIAETSEKAKIMEDTKVQTT